MQRYVYIEGWVLGHCFRVIIIIYIIEDENAEQIFYANTLLIHICLTIHGIPSQPSNIYIHPLEINHPLFSRYLYSNMFIPNCISSQQFTRATHALPVRRSQESFTQLACSMIMDFVSDRKFFFLVWHNIEHLH